MTEQQDVLSPKRRRRHGNTILLGTIPVAVALTALFTAGTWASVPAETNLADGAGNATIAAPAPMPSIVAPEPVVDAAVTVQTVTVTLPPPPEPVVEKAPAAASTSQKSTSSAKTSTTTKKSTTKSTTTEKSTTKESTTKKTTTKSTTQSYKSYCSNPSSPYSASGSLKSLMTAANKERARLGIKPLSWSSSLASAATSWSKSMAAKDTKTGSNALAHNPNRPGAENVAYSFVSSGLSQSGAVARAHKNWMYSNGHCLNIMNPAYSTMGAGAAATDDGNTWYTTANFR